VIPDKQFSMTSESDKVVNPPTGKTAFIPFVAGLVLLTLGFLDIYRWMMICSNETLSFELYKAMHLKQFNAFYHTHLTNNIQITGLDAFLFALAAGSFFLAGKKSALKKISKLLMIICLLLLAWMLFSLM